MNIISRLKYGHVHIPCPTTVALLEIVVQSTLCGCVFFNNCLDLRLTDLNSL